MAGRCAERLVLGEGNVSTSGACRGWLLLSAGAWQFPGIVPAGAGKAPPLLTRRPHSLPLLSRRCLRHRHREPHRARNDLPLRLQVGGLLCTLLPAGPSHGPQPAQERAAACPFAIHCTPCRLPLTSLPATAASVAAASGWARCR